MDRELLKRIDNLIFLRQEQLKNETPGTYNEGFVSGEISGIRKTFDLIKNNATNGTDNEAAQIISELVFAYVGKDEEIPHSFEIEAFEKAADFLIKNNDKIEQPLFGEERLRSLLKELKSKAGIEEM